jgi:hypothetical protein
MDDQGNPRGLKVDAPPAVDSGRGFDITATVTVKNGVQFRNSIPTPLDATTIGEIMQPYFERGDIRLSLSLAGATVEPRGYNPVSAQRRALWSVRPHAPGSLEGFISRRWTSR